MAMLDQSDRITYTQASEKVITNVINKPTRPQKARGLLHIVAAISATHNVVFFSVSMKQQHGPDIFNPKCRMLDSTKGDPIF